MSGGVNRLQKGVKETERQWTGITEKVRGEGWTWTGSSPCLSQTEVESPSRSVPTSTGVIPTDVTCVTGTVDRGGVRTFGEASGVDPVGKTKDTGVH